MTSERRHLSLERAIEEHLEDPEFRRAYFEARDELQRSRRAGVGRRLAALRRQKRLTQAQVAELSRMHRQNIARLESPSYASYTVQSLERLAVAYGQTLRVSFVDEDGNETVLVDPDDPGSDQ